MSQSWTMHALSLLYSEPLLTLTKVDYVPHRWPRNNCRYVLPVNAPDCSLRTLQPAMLTFLTYEVLKRPDVLLKLRAEIDEVLGDQPIALGDVSKMPYTVAVLKEILRFHPPAAARFVHCLEPTTIGKGKYALTPDDHILINSISTNRDPKVWGNDVHSSRPRSSTAVHDISLGTRV